MKHLFEYERQRVEEWSGALTGGMEALKALEDYINPIKQY